MSNNPLLDKLRGMGNGAAVPKPPEAPTPTDPDDPQEASDRAGLCVSRGMLSGVTLEMANGDLEGVYYSALLGRVRYNLSRGITFKFEDAEGLWEVTITGNNLGDLHRDLVQCRRQLVRIAGERVTGIEIKGWKPPKKP